MNKYKVFTLSITGILFFILMTLQAAAQTQPTDTDGDGRINISTLDHLRWVSENPSSWSWDFELDNDIDAGDTRNWNVGDHDLDPNTPDSAMGWSPIGRTGSNAFTGKIYGQGKEIDSLYINRPRQDSIGFLGCTCGSIIENIGITHCDITGFYHVGGLVGKNSTSEVNNSYMTGMINGYNYVGGLVGWNYPSSTIGSSHAEGTVLGGSSTGGLVGWNYTSSTISNSYSTSEVSGKSSVGGLVGTNNMSSSIDNSYASGEVTGQQTVGGLVGGSDRSIITNSYATGMVTGGKYGGTGGLVGLNRSTVNNSYATGKVQYGNYAGGLIGINIGFIHKSYATGDVSGYSRIGGLVGQNQGSISNTYAKGSVTGNDCVGGLIGYIKGAVINSYSTGVVTGYTSGGFLGCLHSVNGGGSCFWNITTSGQPTSSGGIGKTTVEMKTDSTFTSVGWDFNSIWDIDSTKNDGYPYIVKVGKPILYSPHNNADFVSTRVNLDWIGVSGLNFHLQVSKDSNFVSTLLSDTLVNTVYNFSANNELQELSKYYWRVRALDDSLISKWSDIWSFTTDHHLTEAIKPTDTDGDSLLNVSLFAHLVWIFENEQSRSMNFEFDNDIDAKESRFWYKGRGFSPIVDFSGTIDGQGHSIKHLYFNRPEEDDVAFIGQLSADGTVRNLGLTTCYIWGKNFSASLVGKNNVGEIVHCYATGTVRGRDAVGGLIGYNNGNIENCYSATVVKGEKIIGGLVGKANNGSLISKSYNMGKIICSSQKGGGIVGENFGTIMNCYNSGNISGLYNIGGIAGKSNGTISKVYNSGNISGSSGIGACVGIGVGSVQESYWNTETSGITSSNGGQGKTTNEMLNKETYVGWDLSNTWEIFSTINKGYPQLVWAINTDILKSLSPDKVPNLGTHAIVFEGYGFDEATQIYLYIRGQDTLKPDTSYCTANKFTGFYNTTFLDTGRYDVIVNFRDTVIVKEKALNVVLKQPDITYVIYDYVKANIKGSTLARANTWVEYTVQYDNVTHLPVCETPIIIYAVSNEPLQIELLPDTVHHKADVECYNFEQSGKYTSFIAPVIIDLPDSSKGTIHLKVKVGRNDVKVGATVGEPGFKRRIFDISDTLGPLEYLLSTTKCIIDPPITHPDREVKYIENTFSKYMTENWNIRNFSNDIAEAISVCRGLSYAEAKTISDNNLIDAVKNKSCENALNDYDAGYIITEIVNSFDPNDKLGYRSPSGSTYFKKDKENFTYIINFENKDSATAAAQEVFITDTLDKSVFDISSFRAGHIKIGNKIYNAPLNVSENKWKIDMRPKYDLLTMVTLTVDTTSGIAEWHFKCVDPITMDWAIDPIAGFLPPNDSTGRGEGSVLFSINLKDGLADKVEIRNKAKIVFDSNEPILTPEYINKKDVTAPKSQIINHSIESDSLMNIEWAGEDSESGIWKYNLYCKKDLNDYELICQSFDFATFQYDGRMSSTYSYYVLAVDSAGISEIKFDIPELTIFLKPNDIVQPPDTTDDKDSVKISPPTHIAPTNNAPGVSLTEKLDWSDVENAASYEIQIAMDNEFNHLIVLSVKDLKTSEFTMDSSDLAVDTYYYWRVRSAKGSSVSQWSQPWSFKTEFIIPEIHSAPVLISPADSAQNVSANVIFDWSDVANASSYTLEIANSISFNETVLDTVLGKSDFFKSNLIHSDKTYYWRVNAVNSYDSSAWSDVRFFRTELSVPKTLYPEHNSVSIEQRPVFDWQDSESAIEYSLEIATDGLFTNPVRIDNITKSEYALDYDLETACFYYWRVKTIASEENGIWSSVIKFSTAPAAPEHLLPEDNAEGIIFNPTISWKLSDKDDKYCLEFATDTDFNNPIVINNISNPVYKTEYTLASDCIYFRRIKRINSYGESLWSDIRHFRTGKLPEMPQLIYPENNAAYVGTNPNMKWRTTEDVLQYEIEISKSSSFVSTSTKEVCYSCQFVPQKSLEDFSVQYWHVRSKNKYGYGKWSEVSTFKTRRTTHAENPIQEDNCLTLTPNPTNGISQLSVKMKHHADLTIELYDSKGTLIKPLYSGSYISVLMIDPRGLASGSYQIVAKSKSVSESIQLIVRK